MQAKTSCFLSKLAYLSARMLGLTILVMALVPNALAATVSTEIIQVTPLGTPGELQRQTLPGKVVSGSELQVELMVMVPAQHINELRQTFAASQKSEQPAIWVQFPSKPGTFHRASFSELSSDINPLTLGYRMTLSMSPPEGINLFSGLQADVTIDPESFSGMDQLYFAVPKQAVFSQDGETSVWLLDPHTNQVSQQVVTVKSHHEHVVLINGQLTSGQLVITNPTAQLHEAAVVNEWVRQRPPTEL